ncbi:hypothetical protein GCM10027289_24390 [Tsukamurella serpentis]
MSKRTALLLESGPVVRVSPSEVIGRIRLRIDEGGDRPLGVCSINVDHLHHFRAGRSRLGTDVEWLSVADGAPVARRGAVLARAAWPRVTGADLLPVLVLAAAEHGWRIGFVGGTAEMHEQLVAVLGELSPDLVIAGFWAPDRSEIEDPAARAALLEEIRAAAPTVLVVGLGKPRQEQWIDQLGPATGAEVLLPFGAAADFLAGTVERAPESWRRAGAEWLFRLIAEPRRLARRYLVQGPPALLRLRQATLAEVTWPEAPLPSERP